MLNLAVLIFAIVAAWKLEGVNMLPLQWAVLVTICAVLGVVEFFISD